MHKDMVKQHLLLEIHVFFVHDGETRGYPRNEITIPVLSIGFSDGSILWTKFSNHINT